MNYQQEFQLFSSSCDPNDIIQQHQHGMDHHHLPPPNFFYQLPSPFFNRDHDFILTNEQDHEIVENLDSSLMFPNETTTTTNVVVETNPNPRKKDRHSKIHTSQGLRDRRMRLSLRIARKFFDLHDMLGFDKASKTLDWLFNKSKAAIKELTKGNNEMMASPSCSSKKLEASITNDQKKKKKKKDEILKVHLKNHERKGKKIIRNCNPLKKESRDKARDRARERTREKMIIREKSREFQENNPNPNPSNLELLGFSANPMPGSDQHVIHMEDHQSPSLIQYHLASLEIIKDDVLGNASSSSATQHFIHHMSCDHATSGNHVWRY